MRNVHGVQQNVNGLKEYFVLYKLEKNAYNMPVCWKYFVNKL
jgi:hypothetical protein